MGRSASFARPEARSKVSEEDKLVSDKVFYSSSLQCDIVAFFRWSLSMIHSMTAFGTASAKNEHGTLRVECRTVNSRFLDLSLRLPDDLRFLESRLREYVTAHLARGK